jgi:MFS family permease
MAYDIFLAHHLNKKNRGQTVALLQIAIAVSTVLAPIIGGIITDKFGFIYTTYAGLAFFLLSGIILLLTPDEKFKFPYTPKKFVKDLRSETPKDLLWAEFGRCFFDGVMYLLWPLFLVVVITNMTSIGLVAGISSGIGMAVAFWIGKRMDRGGANPESALRHGAYRSVLLNFVRGIWWEPLTIGIIDSLNRVNDQTIKVPYDMQFYKWLHQKNTLERAQIRIFVSQTVYLFCFVVCSLLLFFVASPKIVFISIFVLSAFSLWFTQRISEVGRAVVEVEIDVDTVIQPAEMEAKNP